MNTNVDRSGVFKVISTEHGLGQTRKAGYPQYNVQTEVTAHYDDDTEQWVDYTEYEMEIGVRQCLFGMVGKQGAKELGTTLSYDQVCKVFKWDGADLQVLADIEPGVEFQVTLKDNDPEYADKNPFQVDWIDDFDADPKQKIAKCTKEEITGLNAKYAALLKKKATPAAPKTAKKAVKKTVKKAAPKVPEVGVITKKKKPAVPPPVAAPAPTPTSQVDQYTKNKAWGDVVDLKGDVTDEQLRGAWQNAIHDVSNGQGEEALNGEGWWKVKDRTLNAVGGI